MQSVQIAFRLFVLFEYLCRQPPINLGAGQFFQQFGTFVGLGVQEGGELALRQHHRFGEAAKIQPGDRGN
ncbi:hypothetical protein D3C80_1916770 [compost metagenome]